MNSPKELRKQLRNVTQELLPDLLQSELGQKLYADLSHVIQTRLDVVIANIHETLQQIDQRSKDIQGYLVRQTLTPISTPATTLETTGATVNEKTEQEATQGT